MHITRRSALKTGTSLPDGCTKIRLFHYIVYRSLRNIKMTTKKNQSRKHDKIRMHKRIISFIDSAFILGRH